LRISGCFRNALVVSGLRQFLVELAELRSKLDSVEEILPAASSLELRELLGMARNEVKLILKVALSIDKAVLVDVSLDDLLVQKCVARRPQSWIWVEDNLYQRQEVRQEITIVLERSITGLYHFFV
jgi:hypothetical protein